MADVSTADIDVRIKKVMTEVLDLGGPEQLADGNSLYSPLIQLDSMKLVHLIAALEREFGVEIDEEDVLDADLETVGSVLVLVHGVLVD
ncbi:acyl carrier protein [Amycolatopsis sp. cg5]|uniref:acyl carrier protein n=1 Tax=Amycolatopsis sp. cg5 TaxID=3238802 RepID=UPI0035254F83